MLIESAFLLLGKLILSSNRGKYTNKSLPFSVWLSQSWDTLSSRSNSKKIVPTSLHTFNTRGGGGGGVLCFGSDGGVPLKPPNLYPSKGHFGGKGYPLLGVFIQENDVFVYFSDEMGENI